MRYITKFHCVEVNVFPVSMTRRKADSEDGAWLFCLALRSLVDCHACSRGLVIRPFSLSWDVFSAVFLVSYSHLPTLPSYRVLSSLPSTTVHSIPRHLPYPILPLPLS